MAQRWRDLKLCVPRRFDWSGGNPGGKISIFNGDRFWTQSVFQAMLHRCKQEWNAGIRTFLNGFLFGFVVVYFL
jgi:hypothetical protein